MHKDARTTEGQPLERRKYEAPKVSEIGSVAQLTRVVDDPQFRPLSVGSTEIFFLGDNA